MKKLNLDGDHVFVIQDFLSAQECGEFVALAESIGFADAPITTPTGFVISKDVRDNQRAMLDDGPLAARWYARLAEFMPPECLHARVCGLNERFRFYRYDVGQMFDVHLDGSFRRSQSEESLFTFMIYLNDGFKGGETNFYDLAKGELRLRLAVHPEVGKALVFWHGQLHEGAPVRQGRKYVVRSDVMYRQVGS